MKKTESNIIIEGTTIPKGKVWYAEINGRIFKNSSGHAFFWRKSDLIRSLKMSSIWRLVTEAAWEYTRTISAMPQVDVLGIFWNSYVGEGPQFPCQIKSIEV